MTIEDAVRHLACVVSACVFTVACASGGGTSLPPPLPPAPQQPPPPPSSSIGAPAPASQGASPAPTQVATAGGPRFEGPNPLPPNATFPLIATTLERDGIVLSPVTSNQSATVILKNYEGLSDWTIQLKIPSVGVDTTITRTDLVPEDLSAGLLAHSALSYVSYGLWITHKPQADFAANMTALAFGYETAVSAMPMTGSANYQGNANGAVFFVHDSGQVSWTWVWGDTALTADFAAGKINGALSNMKTGDFMDPNFLFEWNDVSLTANIASGTNQFSGTTAATSEPGTMFSLSGSAKGYIDGAFYGPNAENIGAVWSLSDGTKSAMGGIGAARQ